MPGLYVRVAGTYRLASFNDLRVRQNGAYSIAQALYTRQGGSYALAWRANGPPPAPTGLSSSAANGGVVNVGYGWPANSENDYSTIEIENAPGGGARIASSSATFGQQRTGYAHGASVSLQARTTDTSGLTSAWTAVPGVSAINQAPSPATGPAIGWNGSVFLVGWTNPANPYGDISSVQVWYRNQNEGGWTLGFSEGYVAGARGISLAGRGYDLYNYAFVRVTNAAGYTDSAVFGCYTPPAPGTEKAIGPDSANSYGFTANGWRNDGTVRQGQFSPTPWGLHYGLYFYGDKLWDACHGFQPVSGDIFMMRSASEGFTGNLFFLGHGYGTQPGGVPAGNGVEWTSTGVFAGDGASGWENLPANCLLGMAQGGTKGVGIYIGNAAIQSYYKTFLGPAHNGFAGAIRLRW